MNKKELETLQPQLYARFKQILESKRLGHAYLFSGEMGSFDMAMFVSQSLFCTQKENSLACGSCRNCRLIERGEFSDVTIIEAQGNLIKTDTIRELLKQFSQSGFESNQQVFVIRDAEKMHTNAANSLLKVIEEPQSAIYIFLLTNQEDLILPTIKSRTQIVHFSKNTSLLERVLEEEGLLKTQANLVAKLAVDCKQAKQLASDKSFISLIQPSRKFVALLLEQPDRAYLQVGSLLAMVGEKSEQERLLNLLSLILAEQMDKKEARQTLKQLSSVRQMWKSNVNLHNCLEYLALQQKNGNKR